MKERKCERGRREREREGGGRGGAVGLAGEISEKGGGWGRGGRMEVKREKRRERCGAGGDRRRGGGMGMCRKGRRRNKGNRRR